MKNCVEPQQHKWLKWSVPATAKKSFEGHSRTSGTLWVLTKTCRMVGLTNSRSFPSGIRGGPNPECPARVYPCVSMEFGLVWKINIQIHHWTWDQKACTWGFHHGACVHLQPWKLGQNLKRFKGAHDVLTEEDMKLSHLVLVVLASVVPRRGRQDRLLHAGQVGMVPQTSVWVLAAVCVEKTKEVCAMFVAFIFSSLHEQHFFLFLQQFWLTCGKKEKTKQLQHTRRLTRTIFQFFSWARQCRFNLVRWGLGGSITLWSNFAQFWLFVLSFAPSQVKRMFICTETRFFSVCSQCLGWIQSIHVCCLYLLSCFWRHPTGCLQRCVATPKRLGSATQRGINRKHTENHLSECAHTQKSCNKANPCPCAKSDVTLQSSAPQRRNKTKAWRAKGILLAVTRAWFSGGNSMIPAQRQTNLLSSHSSKNNFGVHMRAHKDKVEISQPVVRFVLCAWALGHIVAALHVHQAGGGWRTFSCFSYLLFCEACCVWLFNSCISKVYSCFVGKKEKEQAEDSLWIVNPKGNNFIIFFVVKHFHALLLVPSVSNSLWIWMLETKTTALWKSISRLVQTEGLSDPCESFWTHKSSLEEKSFPSP